MSFSSLQYNLETASIHFQGGVRRGVFIFLGICLALLIPFYFLGQGMAGAWTTLSFSPGKIDYFDMKNPKTTKVYNYRVDRSQQVPLVGETVLYTTINNQANANIGYNPLTYTIQVLDIKGEIIYSQRQQDFLLPGEVGYIIANPGREGGYELKIIEEPQTKPILFNPLANNFSDILNYIDIRNPKIEEMDEENLELTAILKNNSLVEIRKLEILYLVRGNRDRVIGIGKRVVENFLPGEERFFLAKYPKAKYRRARNLDVRVRVNYLDQENFIIR
jgi:hypothetical protein